MTGRLQQRIALARSAAAGVPGLAGEVAVLPGNRLNGCRAWSIRCRGEFIRRNTPPRRMNSPLRTWKLATCDGPALFIARGESLVINGIELRSASGQFVMSIQL